jgi:LPS export ABC transporter protein LptC
MILFSCKNDLQEVKQITFDSELPALKVIDMHTEITDSGKVRILMDANIMQRFENEEEVYDEYPEGIFVQFIENGEVVSRIKSEYAVFYVEDELWEAKRNVVAENLVKEEKLNTEHLNWDMKKEIIYSEKFVRITTQDEVFFGTGFESDQDFNSWVINNPVGEVTIKDEEYAEEDE